MILKRLVLTSLLLNNGYAFITRLPNCLYDGDFLKIVNSYQTGIINTTKETETLQWCVQKCIIVDGCVSYNYNNNAKTCELLSRRYKKMENIEEWTTGHTDINKKTIGPTCTSLDPCAPSQKCLDTCESPGYTCKDFIDIAPGKTIWQSTTHHISPSGTNYVATNAIDNNFGTFSSTLRETKPYIILDLSKQFLVYFVSINLGPYHSCGAENVVVGDEKTYERFEFNSFCCITDKPIKDCFCFATGRYVTFYSEEQDQVCLFQLTELQVYT